MRIKNQKDKKSIVRLFIVGKTENILLILRRV
jgi:hypothetical protein